MCKALKTLLDSKRGLTTQVAETMEVSKVTMRDWALGEKPVPVARAAPLEKATGGIVMRWHSRPDDWHVHWPELMARPDAPAMDVCMPASSEPAHEDEGAAR